MRRLTKKLIPTAIILILLSSAYFLGLTKSSPQETAETFLELQKNKAYKQAYELMKINDNSPTLKENFYLNWQKNLNKDVKMIEYFEVKTDWSGLFKPVRLGNTATVTYKVKHHNKDEVTNTQESLKLIQVGGFLGLFPEWKVTIDTEDLIVTSQTTGADILLDGVKLPQVTHNKPTELKVFAGFHRLEITTPDSESFKVDKVRHSATIPYLQPKAAALDMITKFEAAWQQGHQNLQNTSLDAFFTPASAKLPEFLADLEEHKAKHKGWLYDYTQNWVQDQFEIKQATVINQDTIQVMVEERWIVTNSYSDGTQSSPSPQGYSWTTNLKKFKDQWLIDD